MDEVRFGGPGGGPTDARLVVGVMVLAALVWAVVAWLAVVS